MTVLPAIFVSVDTVFVTVFPTKFVSVDTVFGPVFPTKSVSVDTVIVNVFLTTLCLFGRCFCDCSLQHLFLWTLSL